MSRQRIEGKRGGWEVSVARHAAAPTFTFDVIAPAADVAGFGETRVISCHNMTRYDLEEHVRNCQAALIEVPDAS